MTSLWDGRDTGKSGVFTASHPVDPGRVVTPVHWAHSRLPPSCLLVDRPSWLHTQAALLQAWHLCLHPGPRE